MVLIRGPNTKALDRGREHTHTNKRNDDKKKKKNKQQQQQKKKKKRNRKNEIELKERMLCIRHSAACSVALRCELIISCRNFISAIIYFLQNAVYRCLYKYKMSMLLWPYEVYRYTYYICVYVHLCVIFPI